MFILSTRLWKHTPMGPYDKSYTFLDARWNPPIQSRFYSNMWNHAPNKVHRVSRCVAEGCGPGRFRCTKLSFHVYGLIWRVANCLPLVRSNYRPLSYLPLLVYVCVYLRWRNLRWQLPFSAEQHPHPPSRPRQGGEGCVGYCTRTWLPSPRFV